ncbi:insulinase family protein [Saccharicrinis fermentans]|uniref:Protease3 n=1 Tax=Saccharicrinis fermentans DSM 9555 = JCM 21142 TaxID=869213 RepID=W7YAM0_9BACT|nr:insulinase family protein [Saccharicrinis fermentans]GAF05417.1 protease3 [Saccharicrinis fermentans DSM 9555 = JCM 21142]
MLKIAQIFLLSLCGIILTAQEFPDALKVQKYTLSNGFTVYLNEDHSTSSVRGMVAVKGGSKRDPEDATGIAHYFEHIMFKGTDKMGTVNYKEEKVYLDSIALEYNKLGGNYRQRRARSYSAKNKRTFPKSIRLCYS